MYVFYMQFKIESVGDLWFKCTVMCQTAHRKILEMQNELKPIRS